MKHEASLRDFLVDHVDLNPTRVERIDDGISTVSTFLENDDVFGDLIISLNPQGSYRQRTGIKPAVGNDYDVDLLVELQAVDEWEPRHYLEELHDRFADTDRYKDIVDKRGKHRCVTLDYASDFHIDIVPSIRRGDIDVVMNRTTNQFEPTDGDGYAKWFEGRNLKAGKGRLVEVVKLMKYLRDAREMPMKSVLLTTLLGTQVRESDPAAAYGDLSTSLHLLVARVDDYFQTLQGAPRIVNPALTSEAFDRHWDDERFKAARTILHEVRQEIAAALAEPDPEASLVKWQRFFGETFTLSEADDPGKVSAAVVPALGNTSHRQQVTIIPGCRGERLVEGTYVRISAKMYSWNGAIPYRGVKAGAAITSNRRIRYTAFTNAKAPYEIYWQVVNTGSHAQEMKGLRGNFFKGMRMDGSENPNQHEDWERTEYTGRHWIECVVVKNGVCIARSGTFTILIKNPGRS